MEWNEKQIIWACQKNGCKSSSPQSNLLTKLRSFGQARGASVLFDPANLRRRLFVHHDGGDGRKPECGTSTPPAACALMRLVHIYVVPAGGSTPCGESELKALTELSFASSHASSFFEQLSDWYSASSPEWRWISPILSHPWNPYLSIGIVIAN